jgi:DNA-binding NarL/FixJ family response regulator
LPFSRQRHAKDIRAASPAGAKQVDGNCLVGIDYLTSHRLMSLKKKTFKSQRRIFIVEDHPVFRDGLVRLLNAENDLAVCGEAGDVEKSLKVIPRLKPDLVVVDLELPGKSGLELIKEVRALKLAVKLLVVSMYDEALYADRVLRAGGDGYIMKQENPEEIIHAIRDVLDGHIYVSEEVFAKTSKASLKPTSKPESRRLDQLTDLELHILELLGRGKNNDEIARQLQLNVRKLTAHYVQMRRKLRLKNDNALIRYAVCWVETGAV